MSPELIKGKYHPKGDIWAVGVILFEMLTGSYPFEKTDEMTIYQVIQTKKLDITKIKNHPEKYTSEVMDFVNKLLTKDLEKRPSSDEALKHPWFTKIEKMEQAILLKSPEKLAKKEKEKKQRIKIMKTAFQNFAMKNIFQKEILYFLARISDDKALAQYKTIFIETDKTCSGTITYAEFLEALEVSERNGETLGNADNYDDQDDYDYGALFEAITFHNKSFLSYTEFIACLFPVKKITNELLAVAFKYFEQREDKKKFVCADSFIRGIQAYGIKVREDEINRFFAKLNLPDNKLTIDAFINTFKKEDFGSSSIETTRHY